MVLAVCVVLVACGGPPAPRRATPQRIRYVVVPHPDDEFEAWAMIAGAVDHYVVFVLLTHGEASRACSGAGVRGGGIDQALLGERLPRPQPFEGPLTPTCESERLDAWFAFLDAMVEVNPNLDVPVFVGHFRGSGLPSGSPARPPSPAYDLYVGARTARVVFDLGDGHLSSELVTWAVQTTRATRTRFPVRAEDDVVAAAYDNRLLTGAARYAHPDHRAVDDALWSTDQGVPGRQWGRTVHADPRRSATFVLDTHTYWAAMAVDPPPADPAANPDARRIGTLQRIYGWLTAAYWPASDTDTVAFARTQDFWSRSFSSP